jgi:hypothetical protein
MGRTGGGWEGPAGGGKDRWGGVDGVKNRSGKWERLAGGLYRVYNTPVHYARGPHCELKEE